LTVFYEWIQSVELRVGTNREATVTRNDLGTYDSCFGRLNAKLADLGESRWDIDAATTVGLKFSGEASGTASGKLSDDEKLQVAAHRLSTERIVLMKTVFTTGEAAKICKVSQQTIIRCFDSGQLKGFRVPGSRFRRIPRDVLYKFMKENGIPTDALESGKRKALIVDDDVELVELITDALVADGRFEVRIANNGFDAGMMVKEYHPDIIVLDVMLPDINGKEVCQRVRSDSALDDVRIICISGMVEQDKIQELKLSGANQFLQKPFEVDTLIDNICRLLDIEQLQS
jgi:excisionase family DNA binding protein